MPMLVVATLGLVLQPFAFLTGLSDNPSADLFALELVALGIAIGYSLGMLRGMLTIILARDKVVELMRATPSSQSFVRRVLAQMWGLPPVFEYATRPWPRFVVIVLASMCSGFFIALATLYAVFGAQAIANAAAKTAVACTDGDCTGSLLIELLVPLLIVGLPLVFLSIGGLLQRGVQRLVRFSLEHLQRTDPRAPMLFLRAFGDDQVALAREKFSVFGRLLQLGRVSLNLDHILLEEVTPYGPHVALGNPKDAFPPYGAARGYFKHKDWKQAVADLARDARAIILCVDPTDGVWWEVDHIAKRGYLDKTLFLIHPKYRAEPDNSELLARLGAGLGIGFYIVDAMRFEPPPKAKPKQPATTVLGFFVTSEQQVQLIYSSTFSRLAYLLAVRFFIRSRIGLAPVPLPR